MWRNVSAFILLKRINRVLKDLCSDTHPPTLLQSDINTQMKQKKKNTGYLLLYLYI